VLGGPAHCGGAESFATMLPLWAVIILHNRAQPRTRPQRTNRRQEWPQSRK
jgi:hypothetical protein